MPRYFFDFVEDGELFVDGEGTELAGLDDARHEAAQIAAEISRDHLVGEASSGYVEVQARDIEGTAVFATSIGVVVDGANVFPLSSSDIERSPRRATSSRVATKSR